jgi:hypothetical protein
VGKGTAAGLTDASEGSDAVVLGPLAADFVDFFIDVLREQIERATFEQRVKTELKLNVNNHGTTL